MSRGPENTFISGVHAHLPPVTQLYREKMANPYRSGTADWWYSGRGTGSKDLWIEWKFIAVPANDATMIDLVSGKDPVISYLQQHWLAERFEDGRNVWVIVGSKTGGVVFKKRAWEKALPAGVFRAAIMERKELARQIESSVTGKHSL